MVTSSTGVQLSVQLGRLSVTLPLRVKVYPDEVDGWVALLIPEELTWQEWGWGTTQAEALEDLASTVWEMRQTFTRPGSILDLSDERLSSELLAYKRALLRYTQVNTTQVMP